MLEREVHFERDTFWLFPHDEEIGGEAAQEAGRILMERVGKNGLGFIIDEGNPAIDNVLPGMRGFFLPVGYTAKGNAKVELDVEFKGAGHGSIPARESAISILTAALNNIQQNPQPNQFGNSLEYSTAWWNQGTKLE